MVEFPGIRVSPDSLIGKWRSRRRHADVAFDCGIRVTEGAVPGERTRWTYRLSGVDPLALDGVRTLNHGATTLRLRIDLDPVDGMRARPGYLVFAAIEVDTGAELLVACEAGAVVQFAPARA